METGTTTTLNMPDREVKRLLRKYGPPGGVQSSEKQRAYRTIMQTAMQLVRQMPATARTDWARCFEAWRETSGTGCGRAEAETCRMYFLIERSFRQGRRGGARWQSLFFQVMLLRLRRGTFTVEKAYELPSAEELSAIPCRS